MFTLKIDLGNAAMRTCDDVSRALAKLAGRLDGSGYTDHYGGIMDDNGNRVGEWKLEGASDGSED